MQDEDRRARGERMFREGVYGDVVPLPPPGQRDDFLALMLDQFIRRSLDPRRVARSAIAAC